MVARKIATAAKEKTGPGWIYVLANPSMRGVVKVGMTRSHPAERARQLSSSTGVPVPFRVIASARVANPEKAESKMHLRLSRWRVTSRREFFKVGHRRAIREMRRASDRRTWVGIVLPSRILSFLAALMALSHAAS